MPLSSTLPDLTDIASAVPDTDEDALHAVSIQLQTLGASRVLLGEQVLGMHNALLFLLVLRMAYTPGMAVARDTLVQEFWPDQEESRQRGNLRQALYKLRTMGVRTALRGDVVHLDPTQVRRNFALAPSADHFDRDITRGTEPYGSFLPGVTPPTALLQEWLDVTRETLHGAMRRVLVDVLRQRRERADWKGTQMVAAWLLQLDPLNEDATLALAECAALSGSKAEAVAILDRYLQELGPAAGDIRLPATLLRRRFVEAPTRRRAVALVTDKHFHGRDVELSEHTMSLRRARWHDGSAVLLHGPPGMGKTRLMLELLKVAQVEGYREVVMECRESITTRPLGALIEALPDLLSAPGAAGCAPESLTVLRKLLGPNPMAVGTEEAAEAAEADPVSHDALSVTERVELAIRTMRAQSIRHAVVDLFAAVSEERPIFLLAEDVNWLDDASWEVLADVIQRVNEMRVYIVLTSRFATIREERPARLPTPLTYRRLLPLTEDALVSLVRGAADEHGVSVPEDVERWIIRGCEGNPLMFRALLEHWAATGNADGIPPSLNALIDQRIDRLHAHAQQALNAISLLGAFASLERIRVVLEYPVHELVLSLDQLELSGCLSTSNAGLVVTHSLVKQAALRRMSPLIEAALRASIGEKLEAEYLRTGDSVTLHEALMHVEFSGRPEVLHQFISKYDESLIEGGRPIGVKRAINTLLLTTPRLFDDRRFVILQRRLDTQAGAYRSAVSSYLGTIEMPTDIRKHSVPDIEELIAIAASALRADPSIDREELARFSSDVANQARLPLATRIRAAEVGLTITANTCDSNTAAICYSALQSELQGSEYPDASLRLRILYHAIFGELSTAVAVAREIVDRCERRPSSTTVAEDLSRAAFAFRLCGDWEKATSLFSKHFEMAEQLGARRLGLYSAWQIAQIELERGDRSRVLFWNKKLAEIVAEENDPISTCFVIGHFCRCAIDEKDQSSARRYLEIAKAGQPKLPAVKASAYVIALELGCELLKKDWEPNDALLEVAIQRHRRTCRFATSDFLTAVLAEAMHRRGYKLHAAEMIDDYTKNARRERGPLSRALTLIANKLASS
ncbi:AAA family ATPase [Gemmatimonas sp.]|jgi:DNA-binding SARP family transcriptional activator|uniref:ATP-binding protein n=1 Tax=Gemmatimonas sp. TaxID=1962908 RepID=UPI0025B905B7|nr:AAA family ATPase [Gemmatimonas sp.]MCA2988500.1 AAA family ATPase [Gemmatimonas sp.]MCA2995772.1 AAA family ATPase [Gemmatimonas sp.]